MNAGKLLSSVAGVVLGLAVLFWLREEPRTPGRRFPIPTPAPIATAPAAAPVAPATAPAAPPLAPTSEPAAQPEAVPGEPATANASTEATATAARDDRPASSASAAAGGSGPHAPTYYALSGDARLAFDRYHREAGNAQARQEALFDLASSTDQPGVLPFLLDEYEKVTPEDREDVLSALVQYGNRDAVAPLKALAAKAGSAEEQVELSEAAEFLQRMSLTEYIEKRPDLHPGADSDRDPDERP